MANEEQARFWAEDGGPRWVEAEQDYDHMPEPRVAQVLDDVRAVLARHERNGEIRLPASVWLMRARRP